jgi:aerobic C4-dicarboxylate transport protein
VATLLIGTWTRQIDCTRVGRVLSGELPFDESVLDGVDGHEPASSPQAADLHELNEAAVAEMTAKEHRARERATQG